jgi:hypothetical protein
MKPLDVILLKNIGLKAAGAKDSNLFPFSL